MADRGEIPRPEVTVTETQQNEAKAISTGPLITQQEANQAELAAAEENVAISENNIVQTESDLSIQDGELARNEADRTETSNQISIIDEQVGVKKQQSAKNTSEIVSINQQISDIKNGSAGGKESPETFEAVGSGKITKIDQDKIDQLEARKAELQKQNAILAGQITDLKNQQDILVARRDNLEDNILPPIRVNIDELRALKKSQTEEKTTRIARRDELKGKDKSISDQISAIENQIAPVATQIAHSQVLFAENAERHSQEQPGEDFFGPGDLWS